jgi:anti-anti-sigma regulatory factor
VLTGDLDQDTAPVLGVEIEHLREAEPVEVVVDVTALERIDESGAVALAELWIRLRKDGIGCRVRGLHPVFIENPLDLLLFVRNGGSGGLDPA